MTERDWKYLRSVRAELLNALCTRINDKTVQILGDGSRSPHERHQAAYKHIQKSDRIVADCFDDWRRSTLWLKVVALQKHHLLKPEHIAQLSPEGQQECNSIA